ncbi:hypothetical protein L3C95_16855 [Chitinophaga filiformis]|uniref:cell envelope integrity protein TolA n=1 Tax=Chitinophaga filiformis TaxID=104663 RepID=UPI001F38F607|nr:cell envelope integrity protein TolA [Chitinophaga filiformis]MCF6404569.1 hypothetical protein [Chitinophaga filiformis]
MRTHYFKSNILLALFLVLTVSTKAQQTTASSDTRYSTRDERTGKERIVTDRGDKTYQLEFTDGKMTFLSVNGVSVPEEKWGDYKTMITEIQEQMKKDKEQARLDRIQAEKDREQAKLDRIQADKDREQGNRDRLQAQKDRAQADRDRMQAEKDRQQADRDRIEAEKDRQQAIKDRAQADKDREQAAKDRVQAEKDRAQAAADRKMLADLTADLVGDKLINDEDDLRMLTLSPTEMTVNGVKQSDAVHKKYQGKYSRFAKSHFSYMSDSSGKRVQIRRDN